MWRGVAWRGVAWEVELGALTRRRGSIGARPAWTAPICLIAALSMGAEPKCQMCHGSLGAFKQLPPRVVEGPPLSVAGWVGRSASKGLDGVEGRCLTQGELALRW